MKKLLNPLAVGAFILVLILSSLAHLMYGSCQASKTHFMMQAYWMPDNLPEWMISNKEWVKNTRDDLIEIPDDTCEINHWDRKGGLVYSGKYENGIDVGVHQYWYDNGILSLNIKYKNGKINLKEKWALDGSLTKKEYYDPKGNFLKREFFEKGKRVKTEVVE